MSLEYWLNIDAVYVAGCDAQGRRLTSEDHARILLQFTEDQQEWEFTPKQAKEFQTKIYKSLWNPPLVLQKIYGRRK